MLRNFVRSQAGRIFLFILAAGFLPISAQGGFHLGPLGAVNQKIDEFDKKIQSSSQSGIYNGYGAITGTVRNAKNAPLGGVEVDMGNGYTSYTNNQGIYACSYVSPGTYHLTAKLSNTRVLTSTVTVVANLDATADFNFGWNIPDPSLSGYYYFNDCYRLAAASSPYAVTGDVDFPNLVIEPGVTVRFNGSYSFYAENITAQGTALNPIVFASGRPTPAPGDFGSVTFGLNGDASAETEMAYVCVDSGSRVTFYGGEGSTVAHCTFKDTNSDGVTLSSKALFQNCLFEKNGPGSDLIISGAPRLTYCVISGQVYAYSTSGQYSINNCNLLRGAAPVLDNRCNWTIDASSNWWGTANDVTIQAYISEAAGDVTFLPHLDAPVATAGPQ